MKFRFIVLVALLLTSPAVAAAQDVVAEARRAAATGRRADALQMLRQRLAQAPDDTDARTLYGTVLSWEGRYDEARRELEAVIAITPAHGDALPALVNVELWSRNPARAEALAARAVAAMPERWDVRVQHARALDALGRIPEAREELAVALRLDPSRQDVRHYRRRLGERLTHWRAGVAYTHDRFRGGRDPWHETHISFSRLGRAGAVGVRASEARRFGFDDRQLEIEAYPIFGDKTTMFAAAAFSDESVLYPEYRLAADLTQGFGPGIEATIGARRLGFDDPVNVYLGALGTYLGNWFWQGRVYYTDAETSGTTWQGAGRRYLDDGVSFVGFRAGRGSVRTDVRDVLDLLRTETTTGALELSLARGRATLDGSAVLSRETFTSDDIVQRLWQTSINVGLRIRF